MVHPTSKQYEEKREEPRRTFNLPLLVNLLVGDGWSDGIIFSAAEIIDTSDESDSKSRILSAIQFVLVHSLRDMDHFATMERARRQELGIDRMKAGMVRNQRMSRAVASSLLPTLSLLRKLVSRPLLVESQAASAMTKMNGSDLESLITNLPLRASDSTSQSKFSATQFTRALHLNIAQIVQEIWSDGQFVSVPSHVMHPWIQLMGEVFQSEFNITIIECVYSLSLISFTLICVGTYEGLEGAGKVDDLAAARDTETLRDLSGANSRSGRILASMGLLQDPNIDNLRDQESDPFEPSEGEFWFFVDRTELPLPCFILSDP